ncbi:winged helix-turn-helix domain-containing protein [Streptomyces phaeochromogenes]|uniref:helix-turn-helix domain-containing protein n=1 Tax=Streptomyces phaeochromogenes TaxID=1923 RepID=UPI00386EB7EA
MAKSSICPRSTCSISSCARSATKVTPQAATHHRTARTLRSAPTEARKSRTGSQLRGWTAPELCGWLEKERGVQVSAVWLTELLHREGFRWKRTRDSVRHQADPVLQQAARARLEDLRTYGWRPTRARAT